MSVQGVVGWGVGHDGRVPVGGLELVWSVVPGTEGMVIVFI